MQTYWTDREIAARLGVARASIWRWVAEGSFPKPIKLSAGCTRWRSADVEAWEQSRQEAA